MYLLGFYIVKAVDNYTTVPRISHTAESANHTGPIVLANKTYTQNEISGNYVINPVVDSKTDNSLLNKNTNNLKSEQLIEMTDDFFVTIDEINDMKMSNKVNRENIIISNTKYQLINKVDSSEFLVRSKILKSFENAYKLGKNRKFPLFPTNIKIYDDTYELTGDQDSLTSSISFGCSEKIYSSI